jgi:uncharacterized protein
VEKEQITAAQPLRVLLVGDSLVLQVGHGVARWCDKLPLEVKLVSKPISGLCRPDFYDWPAILPTTIADFSPDVTVIMLGGNDKQDIVVGGNRLASFSPEWVDEYRSRVEEMVKIAKDAGSRVVWVGLPIMRSAKYAETVRTFNQIYGEACAQAGGAAAGVVFVDCYTLFSDSSGGYSPYLPNSSGKPVLMRNSDGIHLTEAGGDRAAAEIIGALEQEYDLGG